MENIEVELGQKFVSGKLVSLDEEKVERLNKMSDNLKQIEKNLKENIVTYMK